jgi:hypothetical protein
MTRRGPAAGRYAAARRALSEHAIASYAAGICYETPEFLRLNQAVIDAERGVPWWRIWLIDRRVLRELNYWDHMRGSCGWPEGMTRWQARRDWLAGVLRDWRTAARYRMRARDARSLRAAIAEVRSQDGQR